MDNVIEVRGVTKTFPGGTQALCGVDLTVSGGEFVVLLGPSGAGKSTLLRCVNGLVIPSSGQVCTLGHDLKAEATNVRAVRSRVGMIFQQFNLVKRLTVLENVLCGRLSHYGFFTAWLSNYPKEDVELAMECLDRVGLADKAMIRADHLSGGQQQRVGIARALIQQPRVLLADEPVASLDLRSSQRVMEILREINRQDGITVVVSLHQVDLATEYGQRIVGLHNGVIVIDKPAAKFSSADVTMIYDSTPVTEEKAEVRYANG